MRDSSRSVFVSISTGGLVVPKLALNIDRLDASGAASFLAAVAGMLAQELARRDGLSFEHPLAKSAGALTESGAEMLNDLFAATKTL